jgi:hypothetical protein
MPEYSKPLRLTNSRVPSGLAIHIQPGKSLSRLSQTLSPAVAVSAGLLPEARIAHSQIAHAAPPTWGKVGGCVRKTGTGYGRDEREQTEGESADDRLAPSAKFGKEEDADNRGKIKPRTVPSQHATARPDEKRLAHGDTNPFAKTLKHKPCL